MGGERRSGGTLGGAGVWGWPGWCPGPARSGPVAFGLQPADAAPPRASPSRVKVSSVAAATG